MRRTPLLILALFFCSGATALVYEVVWSKYLGLIFGSTIQAQTVVLAVFMGGLALGNAIFGRRADLLARPLAAYGYIESVIALFAFFFDQLYAVADKIFVAVGSSLLQKSAALLALKGAVALGLLLLPTILMGGTLPLLAAWLAKESRTGAGAASLSGEAAEAEAGRRSARFYSTNSLGAVFGSFMAGFILLRELGLVSGLQLTAMANLLVGLTAIGLARRESAADVKAAPAESKAASTGGSIVSPDVRSHTDLFVLVSITGAVSMGLEVLASRCLALIFGASLQAFAIVLMAFILGIGLGSAVIASPRVTRTNKERTTVILLLAAAFCVGSFIFTIEQWTFLYAKARSGLAPSSVGFVFHQVLVAVISIVVLGLPAALLGSVLPLCIRVVSEKTAALGDQVGRLLTWNTLGAVVGVLITGFILMPKIGLRGALATLAIALCVVAVALAVRKNLRAESAGAGMMAVLLIAIALSSGENWRHVLGSGIFRLRAKEVNWESITRLRKESHLYFYEDAADATVSVESSPANPGELALRINGKPDASTSGDLSTQYLLGHLPLLTRPNAKEVFILGFGSGITGGAVLGHPIDRLTIAENCEPILRAAKLFEPWNRSVLKNSRTRVVYEDARTVLKLSPQNYDVIISEPSNPWVAGIGNVFSHEFYELCASRLGENGLMAQWFHLYEMHDGIVFLVLRTFSQTFPNMEVWDTESGDIILLGSKKPWQCSPESFRAVFGREQPRKDLERIGIKTPEAVFARQLASQRTASSIPGGGPTQSDIFPVLEYSAPMAFYIGQTADQLFQFDERTLLSQLAPAEKKGIVGAIADADLTAVFKEFNSSNKDLADYMEWRRRHGRDEVYQFNPLFASIFRPAQSYPDKPEMPEKISPEAFRLRNAQALIFAHPERWREAVDVIDTELAAYLKNKPAKPDWNAGAYAALAVRTRLANGDLRAAVNSLFFGLRADPQNAQLLFLSRLLDKEAPELMQKPS